MVGMKNAKNMKNTCRARSLCGTAYLPQSNNETQKPNMQFIIKSLLFSAAFLTSGQKASSFSHVPAFIRKHPPPTNLQAKTRQENDSILVDIAIDGGIIWPEVLGSWTQGVAKGLKTSITTAVHTSTRKIVKGFTGKETYQFGDISREILRRVASGEYSDEDIMSLARMMVGLAISLTPVARFAPVRLLLQHHNIPDNDDLHEMLWIKVYERLRDAIREDETKKDGDNDNDGYSRIQHTAKTLLGIMEGEVPLSDIPSLTKEVLGVEP